MERFFKNGSEYITSLVNNAVVDGSRTATVTGNYEIETVVYIPSDFTLVLDGCHLKMADGVFSNMFRNRNGKSGDRNIKIIGKNGAVLDGGNYNGLSEKTQRTGAFPPIWYNNLVLFVNVDGFEESGFSCINQRWWALNHYFCRNGKISNIHFCSSDMAIDENGNEYRGLIRARCKETLVKNSDGIDLRQGCRDILIENITGFTEDDTVALTNLDGRGEKEFGVEGLCKDICNVTIRNVHASAFCSIIRLLNQGGTKLHDIVIDDIYDTSENSPHMDVGQYGVRIGDGKHMYGSRHATKDETYNITVKNVYARSEAALSLSGGMSNVTFENITVAPGTVPVLDERLS